MFEILSVKISAKVSLIIAFPLRNFLTDEKLQLFVAFALILIYCSVFQRVVYFILHRSY
jgi:hypothetical protein